MAIDIEDVLTEAQLAAEIGGTARLTDLLSRQEESGDGSLPVRERALADVLRDLSRRTPPIYENQISVPADLRDAVTYNALERLYREAMTAEGDVYAVKRKLYERRYIDEVRALRPTLAGELRGGAASFRMERG